MQLTLLKSQSLVLTLFFLTIVLVQCQEKPVKDNGQPGDKIGDLRLLDWDPQSMMVTSKTKVKKSRFPSIDIHNHLLNLKEVKEYIPEMDKAGVQMVILLDGHAKDEYYKEFIETIKKENPDRLIPFFTPDFSRIDEEDFGMKQARLLEEAVELGARGMKIFKSLGLTIKDSTGKVVPVDDPRIDPIWAKCGELGIPVMIHVSDPKAFFTPIDKFNERYDELGTHPQWAFSGEEYPEKNEILDQRNRVMQKHPNTIFIGAHVGNLPEELHRVGEWLDTFPNFYVDIDARISELGRQPYTARKFFIEYQDRIHFGSDTKPSAEAYRIYWEFLETDNEYINPAAGHHLQGRWMIYGVFLPDEVLEKVYHKNALKIFGLYKGPGEKVNEKWKRLSN